MISRRGRGTDTAMKKGGKRAVRRRKDGNGG